MTPRMPFALLALTILLASPSSRAAGPLVPVGVARLDATPDTPVMLAGYQQRTDEARIVAAPLHVRALAIGSDADGPVVLVAAEVIAMSEALSEAVAAAVRAQHPAITRERIAVCATHQHTGPAIAGAIPFMFSRDLPAEATAHIARFTDRLREKMIAAAFAALADRKPARLSWAQGTASFAVNRRKIVDGKHAGYTDQPGGVVDHALPVLRAVDESGAVRAVLVNYACHCTVLKGGDNFIHPDWAGDAATRLEAAHPGAAALVTIGCGADADPQPRGLPEVATHGKTVAAEVARLFAGELRPVGRVTSAKFQRIAIPVARTVTRGELRERLKGKPNVAYAAAQFLRRLDAGQPLPAGIDYPVQAWAFGDEFAMVFLGGEVVADYALRLKRELGAARVWVNAYANHVPCYIPSTRILAEGGYEAEAAMDYYGLPTRLAPDVEERIVRTVHALLPAGFAARR
ncbi:MAG: neutral/alkaline non-lysosomal ceramidase N-terminal domain-containing protein [Verrucomicrobia bacterium]|nr:neutral/alkaline non-lysosomal ceramidase N-terminal domain-containing protein [Verrucomicrobiota bacterium]